jgi:hypothetical protein
MHGFEFGICGASEKSSSRSQSLFYYDKAIQLTKNFKLNNDKFLGMW